LSRARATALALVNWKGVFFERYLLDRHVTALEGANGAGKTTVMIAAYVVLLPDMTRLRFTNVGESAGSGDRGIWGRLGEEGRPSYSAIQFEFGDGQRLLAGVQLARKAEPSVELVPFFVTGIDDTLKISDLLLISRDGHDEVPDLEALGDLVASRGARLETFQSAKDYFSALFEKGVTPLRLGSDEERNKLNEMLRTSMTGGISRALTSELRGFLLREESGLSDTLRRMRENLEACRRTREEVAAARTLEQEISSIYDAGQAMFQAAFGSARARADEQRARIEQAALAFERAEAELAALDARLAEATAREAAHAERRGRAELELGGAQERAQRAERARVLSEKLGELTAEREQKEASAKAAREKRAHINARRKELKQQRDALRESYERAARGLSDSERGLDELHRNAADQRRGRRLLAEIQSLLEDESFTPVECEDRAARVRAELLTLDQERARADRARELQQVRERDRARAYEALRSIAPGTEHDDALAAGREALAQLARLEIIAAQRDELARTRDEAVALAARQRNARTRAAELGLGDSANGARANERLRELQIELEALETGLATDRDVTEAARAELERVRRRQSELEQQRSTFDDVASRKKRLAEATAAETGTRDGLATLHSALFAEREQLRLRFRELSEERASVTRTRSALESGSGSVDPELIALCEELEGELLANRFEELDISQAALLEAELGPLARAIVVDDVERAAHDALKSKHELDLLLLVQEGADPRSRIAPPRVQGRTALFKESFGLRIARLPENPSLGFLARKRRAEELAARARAIDTELEALEQSLRQCESRLRECEELLARGAALELADPRPVLAELEQEAARLTASAESHAARAREALAAAGRARVQRDGLLGLLSDAFLLDPPEHAARAEQLRANLEEANRARQDLERLSTPRATLSLLLDALAGANGEDVLDPEQEKLRDTRRERSFRALEAITELERVRHALAFEDAEALLRERSSLLPALEAQHRAAEEALAEAERALGEADADWEGGALLVAQTEAERAAVEAHANRLAAELAELGLDAEAQESSLRAKSAVEHWARELAALSRDERELAAERAVSAERQQKARERVEELKQALSWAREALSPAEQTYSALRDAAEHASLRVASTGESQRNAEQLSAEAQSKLELLSGRLATARGANELIERLHAEIDEVRKRGDSAYLAIWLSVRDWLARRVPAQIADTSDPLLGLERLRDQLSVLEHRLTRQELDLRGASEDVARGIEVGLRRAKAQVRRLNQSLDGVAFGSVQGVRVELRRVERMDQVLTALRNGAAQELLFQSNLPIEEALNEIFKRFAGGKTGGQRLLDYREYLELTVEIRRQTGSDWEAASPARLSTGEAIGVGATLMMVILTEWERDANLLRGKRAGGTLRFLFLDEANRLSQDNLGVLFELCKTLDLQLLIAAPEVARADGNTTYRLVRRLTDDGREEVLVSGRRVQSLPEEPPPEAASAVPAAEQLSLIAES
jgi:chromosome partition protein MukB